MKAPGCSTWAAACSIISGERDQPFTLTSKCVEIHHWQHGLRVDAQGKGYIDEERVKTLARQTLADPRHRRRAGA